MVHLKKLTLYLLLTLSQTYADTLGGEVSLGFFNHQPNGNASYKGSTTDMEDTLSF
jgi:hypothetical protein